jgi:hypothetical protein
MFQKQLQLKNLIQKYYKVSKKAYKGTLLVIVLI